MSDIINEDWLKERGGVVCRFDALQLKRTALLVIDMQEAFVDSQYGIAAPGALKAIPKINQLGTTLRQGGGRVVFTRHTTSDEAPFILPDWLRKTPIIEATQNLFLPGTPSHALHKALEIDENDIIVDKHRYSAFLPNSSTLHGQLRMAGVDTVIIVGTVTNVCCESNARDAHMLDYKVFFPFDTNVAITKEGHQAALANLSGIFADVRSSDELLRLILASPGTEM